MGQDTDVSVQRQSLIQAQQGLVSMGSSANVLSGPLSKGDALLDRGSHGVGQLGLGRQGPIDCR
jgi:hypothetical protein